MLELTKVWASGDKGNDALRGLGETAPVATVVRQAIELTGYLRLLKEERRDYLRYLTQLRRQVRKVIVEQQQAQAWRHPEPTTLWSIARSSRLWERRATHDDFGEVRVAVGDQRLAVTMAPVSSKPVEDLEPLCAHALRRFIRAYSTVTDQPIALFLPSYARVLLQGDPNVTRHVAHAMLAQLAVFHAPARARRRASFRGTARPMKRSRSTAAWPDNSPTI